MSGDKEEPGLAFTGERFTPECVREIWYEHFHRYAFAATLCEGASVLDAACGEGYGSALLAARAARVTGVDLSGEAVSHANQRYGQQARLDFVEANVCDLPFPDDHFDRVVSFETLEHLHPQEAMLAEFRRVLKPDGVLIISSPDKAIYTDKHGSDNVFHVRELYRDELETLLAREFPAVRLFGQKLLFHSAIWSLTASEDAAGDENGVERLRRQASRNGELADPATVHREAMYLIAVCAASASMMPETDAELWLFDDEEESVYTHYHGEIRRNMAAGGIIKERDEEIAGLRAALEEARRPRSLWQRLFGGKAPTDRDR